MKFNPGDLVVIVADDSSALPHGGKVGSVIGTSFYMSAVSVLQGGLPYYRLTCLAEGLVAREDAIKKIGGGSPTIEVDEKRDEPVAA